MKNTSVDRLQAALGELAETWAGGLPAFGADAVGADAFRADAVGADAFRADAVGADAVGADAVGADAVGDEFEALSGPGLVRVVEAIARMRRSLDAALAHAADEVAKRSARGFGAEGLAKQHGFSSPARLLAAATGGAPAEASRLLAVGEATRARASFTGEPLPAKFASVRRALDDGALSVDAAAAITGMLRRVEVRAEASLLEPYEQRLVEFAEGEPLSLVLHAVNAAEARLDHDGVAPTDERLFTERALTLHQDSHGVFHLRGRLDPVTAAPIKAALDALVSDALGRRGPGQLGAAGGAGAGGGSGASGDAGASGDSGASGDAGAGRGAPEPVIADERSIPQLQADALAELAKHVLGCTSGPGTAPKTTIVVRMSLDALRDGTGLAEIDGIDRPVAAATARKLAADAEVIPIVLGADSAPLDLGRTTRLFTKSQRVALMERDGGCASCGANITYADAHHIAWWAKHGGRTDLANGVMLRLSHECDGSRRVWGIVFPGQRSLSMAVNVRSGGLDQVFLMPPSIRDWLPEDHLAFLVLDVVAELDLSAFHGSYRADGRGGAVYDPALMLAVLVYAYCTGERSSRRIERRLVEDVAYRVVAANQTPDHATLARFRRRHQDAIGDLFGQVLGLCVTAGLVDARVVAIDGTKIAADASFFANRTREDLAAQILAEADQVDQAEDELFGDKRGDELPAQWTGGRDRRERIRTALDELERQEARDYESRMAERARKEAASGRQLTGPKPTPDPARRAKPRRANTTDPHSRIIANAHGALQGYNAQTAATVEQIVVAAEVTVTTNDQPHFVPMAQAVTENLVDAGAKDSVGVFVADAGYWTAANGAADVGAITLIATKKPPTHRAPRPDDHKLTVLAKVNRGELTQRQAGEILGVSHTWVGDMTKRYFSKDGPRNARTAEPEPARWLPVIERLARGEITKRIAAGELDVSMTRVNNMLAHVRGDAVEPSIARQRMDAKLAEPTNADIYRKRQHSIEPVFGNIKNNLGYRRFTRRSIDAVHSEWRLICTAHNLLKLRTARLA